MLTSGGRRGQRAAELVGALGDHERPEQAARVGREVERAARLVGGDRRVEWQLLRAPQPAQLGRERKQPVARDGAHHDAVDEEERAVG
eukprot:scaffold58136_cov18-Tisochrysis_lutea.AAC.1